MKSFKKLICVAASLLLLAGCNKTGGDSSDPVSESTSEVATMTTLEVAQTIATNLIGDSTAYEALDPETDGAPGYWVGALFAQNYGNEAVISASANYLPEGFTLAQSGDDKFTDNTPLKFADYLNEDQTIFVEALAYEYDNKGTVVSALQFYIIATEDLPNS